MTTLVISQEDALEKTQAVLDCLMSSVPIGLGFLDKSLRYVHVNDALAKMNGVKKEDHIGKTAWEIIPYLRTRLEPIFKKILETGKPLTDLEICTVGPQGTPLRGIVNYYPVRKRNGEIFGIGAIILDVSEQRKVEHQIRKNTEELARSNAELEQFAYIASHDLKEPLRMVASYVQLLELRYRETLDLQARQYINYAVEGTRRMYSLITDLLSFSRVRIQERSVGITNLSQVVATAWQSLALDVEETGARLEMGELPAVKGDRRLLLQVYQHLIANSIKFRGPKSPVISVACSREKNHWVLRVSDNGIGIKPTYSQRIFSIFQRLHTREEYPGNGIGLALCKKIIERHGGNIGVDSDAGRGATFWFTLPAEETEVFDAYSDSA